jgi:putative ABC transport system ATP-binding protein
MTPLVVDQVEKRFRQGDRAIPALSGVTLEVAQGQFLAIMGASGSGKSTLLHLMAGLTQADAGRVVINGTDLGMLNDHALTLFRRRQIGLVFQSFNLIPTLTAEENIMLPLLLEGNNGQSGRNKVGELLDTLGLTTRRHHRPDAMSGGEQQRVAIGRALVADPAVILADEPTGELDGRTEAGVLDLLLAATRRGVAVLVASHSPAVTSAAGRHVRLLDGQVVS